MDILFYAIIAFCIFDALFLLAVLRGGALRERRQADAASDRSARP